MTKQTKKTSLLFNNLSGTGEFPLRYRPRYGKIFARKVQREKIPAISYLWPLQTNHLPACIPMKEQIQQLIAVGRTEDALALLAQQSSDALLLQARYNNGKKQYNMGLIEFSEWQRTQAQINYAALELANSAKGSHGGGANPGAQQAPANNPVPANPRPQYSVFISYNHNDALPMRAIKANLEDNGIKVFVDIQDMGVGDNIQAFIDKALKENNTILSVISQNSLKSGWVNKELSTTLIMSKFDKKWIPVLLDRKCFEPAFYNDTMDEFDQKIADVQAEISKALAKNRDIRAFTDELERLKDLQSDFSKTIQALKGHLVEDISGNMFEFGMSRVVKAIKG